MSIAIVDEAGRLLYFQRMDDATNASVEVSIAKALHAVAPPSNGGLTVYKD